MSIIYAILNFFNQNERKKVLYMILYIVTNIVINMFCDLNGRNNE